MSEATIREQIYTILSGLTDIGKVYDYERWAVDWATFINLFKTRVGTTDQIRGWEINRKAVKGKTSAFETEESTHSYVIRGYLGLNDANETEKTFNGLVEAVRDAFRDHPTLNAAAEYHGGIQAEVIEPRMFGGVLCHYAELVLEVSETNAIE